ncbi:MAG: ATP-binding cassette domain-containing protein [Myxococcota bacterium]|nr:ATP-binding cassette domain-containing protein [Myxococcota bacterium]
MTFVVENLSVIRGGERVVKGICFSVSVGEIFAVLGPNGAGKSTCFEAIAGLRVTENGSCSYNGTRWHGPLWKRVRLGLGYMPQRSVALWDRSVEQNLRMAVKDKEHCDLLLDKVGLIHRKSILARDLSGGEIRRLELARCLALDPKVLLLDEPFAALDPKTVSSFQELLRSLSDRIIIFTDHSAAASFHLCDRALILDNGKILACGYPKDLAQNPLIRNRYLGVDFKI